MRGRKDLLIKPYYQYLLIEILLKSLSGFQVFFLLLQLLVFYSESGGLGSWVTQGKSLVCGLQGPLYIAERAFLSFSSESVRRGLLI